MNDKDLGSDCKDVAPRHTMKSFPDVVSRRNLVGKWKPTRKPHTLWDEAVAVLGVEPPMKQSLDGLASSGSPDKVVSLVLEKLEECRRKKLKFKRKDGTEIIVSEQLEKIAKYIERFKEIVDEVVQYDPGIVSFLAHVLLCSSLNWAKDMPHYLGQWLDYSSW